MRGEKRIYREHSLLGFQTEFSSEEACLAYLKKIRWPHGFRCPRCGNDDAWFIKTRNLLDCKRCRAKISLTAGTIFHKTRTPLVKWYWLIYHMAMKKVGVSISEMQRELEIKDYKTAWLMAHKVRAAMAERTVRYSLAGLIKMDYSFFRLGRRKLQETGDQRTTVLCAVALVRDLQGIEKPGFAHMQVVAEDSLEATERFLQSVGCGRDTDEGEQLLKQIEEWGWRPCGDVVREHFQIVVRGSKDEMKFLPWVLRVISNAKAVILAAHRGVSDKHLQAYLSEICYRFNHRFWERELFDRLLQACVLSETVTYRQLTDVEAFL